MLEWHCWFSSLHGGVISCNEESAAVSLSLSFPLKDGDPGGPQRWNSSGADSCSHDRWRGSHRQSAIALARPRDLPPSAPRGRRWDHPPPCHAAGDLGEPLHPALHRRPFLLQQDL